MRPLTFFAMPETLRRTALPAASGKGDLSTWSGRCLRGAGSGRIVQGHVDGVGEVLGVRPEGDAEIWEFGAPDGTPLLRPEGQHLRRRHKPDDRLYRGAYSYGLDSAPDPSEHEPGGAR